MEHNDTLEDFTPRGITVDSITKIVHVAGSGPAVVLMPELPGISPDVARFGRWIRDAGFTVYMPSLFGIDGAYPTLELGREIYNRVCVSAEFRVLAGGGTSPVVSWLRGLARIAHQECGGSGVGAIGLCLTGNFALTMALEPSVIASVVNHPSLPLDNPGALEISPADATAIAGRFERDDLRALGYRFEGDKWCGAARFAAYRNLLGDRFDGRVLDDKHANPTPPPFFAQVVETPHSVVTAHLVDTTGHPTLEARDEILAFLTTRLTQPSS
ncbi:dienelactone hydrolase family protein [Nocardia alni]|uniref:dienelactone hydrolase family protein n=1 Tax=Nocardia alni TaxID=2815723 RepID=UPI001C24F392|nr:dienelactone hydrolase family protein [Nocardia alni]